MRYPLEGETSPTRSLLERLLFENVLPYWSKRVDRAAGGYDLCDDAAGGTADRHLVAQARTLWFYSRLAASPEGRARDAEIARHGFAYLRDVLWDRRHGGFYWQVDRDGRPVLDRKHLYGQAFGLFALAEFFRLTGDPAAAELASECFERWEDRAHDPAHGGYVEAMSREWEPETDAERTYLGSAPGMKLVNTHLHLLEALGAYREVSDDPRIEARMGELLDILSKRTVDPDAGVVQDRFDAAWHPLAGRRHERVSFGHELERSWLVLRAAETLGRPLADFIDGARSVFEYATLHGRDETSGGFYESGRLGRRADRRDKIWWVQAEALTFCVVLHRVTGEPAFAERFSETLGWIADRQSDWQAGEWHNRITKRGRPRGEKAGPWKSPYHNGRAILESLRHLDRGAGARVLTGRSECRGAS